MKYHIAMKGDRLLCLVAAWLVAVCAFAVGGDDAVPTRPDPPRLVNDLAGILGDTQAMEDSLEAFARRTSNQIVVVTVKDLNGYDPTMLAYEIGQRWGVGSKKHNNGVVVLVKPKNSTRGTATVAPGYGLEGALPDAFCRRVVEREMIPHFKTNDYGGGVWAALKVIMPIAAGEYSEQQYMGDDDDTEAMLAGFVLFVIFCVVVFVAMRRSGGNGNSGTFGGGGPIIFPPMGGGGSSGGSSSFGGFGGFGGGSFGGGGASGSW